MKGKKKSSPPPKFQRYFWRLPSPLFGGNKLDSYGGRISFALKNDPGIRAGEVRGVVVNILVGVGWGGKCYELDIAQYFYDSDGHRQRFVLISLAD